MSHPHTNHPMFAKDSSSLPRWTVGDVIDFEEAEQRTLSGQDAENVLGEDGKVLSRTFSDQKFRDVSRDFVWFLAVLCDVVFFFLEIRVVGLLPPPV